VLEPVLAKFVRPQITYGFASRALLRLLPAHAAPPLDQPAACELNQKGKPICLRLGAAVNMRIEKVTSKGLAIWMAQTLPIDRLYFYGSDRPVYVSIGPERTGRIVAMLPGPSGRRVPRRISIEWLKQLEA
jgi:hypothetical protein